MSTYKIREPKSMSEGIRALFIPDISNYDRRFFRAIASYIINVQRNDFHLGVRLAGVKLCPKTRSDTIMSRFAFTQPGRRPIKLYTRRRTTPPPKSSSKLEIEEIQVSVWGAWLPFLAWIQIEYGRRVGPNYTLFDWWKTNGRSFRFMDLPLELRYCIYQEIITPYTWPHINHRGSFIKHTMETRHMIHWGACFRRAPSGHAPPTPTTLPAVSKQVAIEFHRFAKKYTTAHFLFPEHLQAMITYPKMTNCLRRVSLGFPNWMYLKFIGFRSNYMDAFEDVPNTPSISILRHIDTLEHINFHFQIAATSQGPDGQLHSWEPWSRIRSETYTKVSCQKLFVEMFFLFALGHIRHIPRITLSGHVKDSTREIWTEIFQRERKGDHWDTSELISWWMSRPAEDFPLDCFCEQPCNYWLIHGPLPEGCKKPEYSPHDWEYDPAKHDPFICGG